MRNSRRVIEPYNVRDRPELISNDEGDSPSHFLEWCMNFLADLDETENLLRLTIMKRDWLYMGIVTQIMMESLIFYNTIPD